MTVRDRVSKMKGRLFVFRATCVRSINATKCPAMSQTSSSLAGTQTESGARNGINIHPVSIITSPALKVTGGLEPIPAVSERRQVTSWTSHHLITGPHTKTNNYLQPCSQWVSKMCIYYETGRSRTTGGLRPGFKPTTCPLCGNQSTTVLSGINITKIKTIQQRFH